MSVYSKKTSGAYTYRENEQEVKFMGAQPWVSLKSCFIQKNKKLTYSDITKSEAKQKRETKTEQLKVDPQVGKHHKHEHVLGPV